MTVNCARRRREPGRDRAVRPRARRLHRRRAAPRRAVRAGRRRHPVPRRDRRAAAGLQAKLLRVLEDRGICAGRQRARAQGRRARRRGDQPRPLRGRGARAAASARTCTTGCGHRARRCRRCASAAATCQLLARALPGRPAAARYGARRCAWTPARSRRSAGHAWPGNVRELRNVHGAGRAAVGGGDVLGVEDLALGARSALAIVHAGGRRRRRAAE